MIRISALLVFMVSHIILFNCKSESDFKKIFVEDEESLDTDAVIRDFLVDSYEKNRLLWELRGKRAYINWEDENILIFTPKLKYIGRKKTQPTHIYGEKGSFKETQGILFLEKNVKIISQNGKKIYTDYLYWYKDEKVIKTNAPVKVVMPSGSIIRGIGLRADMRLDKIKIMETMGNYYTK